ncbi:MAG: hypothetical protein ACRC0X_07045 [Brevinema sp.]
MKYVLLMMIILLSMGARDSVIASYDKGLDLVLLNSTYVVWHTYQLYSQQDKNMAINYSAKYWDKKNNQYYTTDVIYKTNNILYNIDNSQVYERLLDKELKEVYYTTSNNLPYGLGESNHRSGEFKYVGSITPLERVYIDVSNKNIQYIKVLSEVSNIYYKQIDPEIDWWDNKYTLISPLYPIYPYPMDILPISDEEFLSSPVIVTNKEGLWFDILEHGFLLETNL